MADDRVLASRDEAVLATGGAREQRQAVTTDAATFRPDLSQGTLVVLTVTQDVTILPPEPTPQPDRGMGYTLVLVQDGTGGHTVDFGVGHLWPGGTAPTLTATARAIDRLEFVATDGGTNWMGELIGADYSDPRITEIAGVGATATVGTGTLTAIEPEERVLLASLNGEAIFRPSVPELLPAAAMSQRSQGMWWEPLDGFIYAGGGFVSGVGHTSRVERYDPAQDAWETMAPMPGPKSYGASGVLADGLLHTVGGFNGGGTPEHFIYDPDTDSWSTHATTINQNGVRGIVIDGEWYLFKYQSGWKWNPATETFDTITAISGMADTAGHIQLATLGDGLIYALDNGGTAFRSYDPDTGTTTTLANGPGKTQSSLVSAGGKLYNVSGKDQFVTPETIWEYDPGTDTWTQLTGTDWADWGGYALAESFLA